MARTARRSTDAGEPGFIQVHARMPEHPKIAGLSDRAFRVLVETWCWSWRNRTDGHVPAGVWSRAGSAAVRRELVRAGLADEAPDGVVLHDWLDWQESVAAREELSRTRSEAGKRGAAARWTASATASATASGQANAMASGRQVPRQNDGKTMAEIEIKALTPVEPKTHVPRSPSQRRAEELNATSRRADTQRLLNDWEAIRGTPILPPARRQWTRAVDDLLDHGVPHPEIAAALPILAARGLGPSLLASIIEEQRGKRANTPIHQRQPEHVTDEELTPAALDELLGEDARSYPPPPDDVEHGPHEQRSAWYAARRAERLTERRAEARRLLARNQAAAT